MTILYGGAVALALLYGAVEFDVHTPKEAELFIELVEPKPDPVPVVAQSRPSPKPEVAPHHPQPAEQESTQQVSGEEPKTQTVNQRALFKMNNGEAETAEKSGNPLAQKGEKEQSSGTSHGLNPIGTDALDEGLQGRDLRENCLCRPIQVEIRAEKLSCAWLSIRMERSPRRHLNRRVQPPPILPLSRRLLLLQNVRDLPKVPHLCRVVQLHTYSNLKLKSNIL